MRKLTTTTLILISTIAMTNIAMADNYCKDLIQITLNMSDKFINNYKYLYYNPGGYDHCSDFNQSGTNAEDPDCECDYLDDTYDLETPTPYGKYKPDNEKGFHNEYYDITLPFGADGSDPTYRMLFTEKNITTDIELSVTWTNEPNTYTIKYEDGTNTPPTYSFQYFSDQHIALTPTDPELSLENLPGQYFSAWKCTNCENPDKENILPNQRIIEPSAQTASTAKTVVITLTPVWENCPKGYYCPAGEHKIYPCPAGLTTDDTGKSSISDCIVEANKTTIKDSSGQDIDITPQSNVKFKLLTILP